MGIPGFFAWIKRHYPDTIRVCSEENSRFNKDRNSTANTGTPSTRETEFHNLYLDLSWVIRSCLTDEIEFAPNVEDNLLLTLFAYIDRVFAIVRPRRLLYIAIDGVAPNAKMNRRRGHRFQCERENEELMSEVSRIKTELRREGRSVPPDKPAEEYFDGNCLTTGTSYMSYVAECLRYYIRMQLSTSAGWKDITVILSDASVPGEGEHKIVDFIRRQREEPDYDPDTHHCVCGNDADLILLGLATHEPNFTIIREEFQPTIVCKVCYRAGHEAKDCQGLTKNYHAENRNRNNVSSRGKEELYFIFLDLGILRRKLYGYLSIRNPAFPYDMERAIDDWVCLCFLIENDFLPPMSSLRIPEGIIETLVDLYKQMVTRTGGGYLTYSGTVNLRNLQFILTGLARLEDETFRRRRNKELSWQMNDRNNPKQSGDVRVSSAYTGNRNMRAEQSPSQTNRVSQDNSRQENGNCNNRADTNSCSRSAGEEQHRQDIPSLHPQLHPAAGRMEIVREDNVKLWEAGWKARYYAEKFGAVVNSAFRTKVADEYVAGICWGLKYYYQGCPSWNWYYPYHYAPFASDFIDISQVDVKFKSGTKPLRPLEQLICILPAGSRHILPQSWQDLVVNPRSPIIDFYPENFVLDMVGKRYTKQAVALLPFVDIARLMTALYDFCPDLTEDEMQQNQLGSDELFVSSSHRVYTALRSFYTRKDLKNKVKLKQKAMSGVRGSAWCAGLTMNTGVRLVSPFPLLEFNSKNKATSVHYENPRYKQGHVFQARLLHKRKGPQPVTRVGGRKNADAPNLSVLIQTNASADGPATKGNSILSGHKSIAVKRESASGRKVPKSLLMSKSEARKFFRGDEIEGDGCSDLEDDENVPVGVKSVLRKKRFQYGGLVENILTSSTNVGEADDYLSKATRKEGNKIERWNDSDNVKGTDNWKEKQRDQGRKETRREKEGRRFH